MFAYAAGTSELYLMNIRLFTLVMLLGVVGLPLHAHEMEPEYNVYALSAAAEADINNDQMSVELIVQSEGSDASELADRINSTMSWALTQLQPFDQVIGQTQDYQTYPQYERNQSRIIGWRARQSLHLESENFEQIGKAVQVLQERLQVVGMQMSVKNDTRKKAEDKLINTALHTFKQRALLVQQNMNARGYRIMRVSINTDGTGAALYAERGFRGVADMAVQSAPAIEAGKSHIQVRINGQIQLD